MSQRSDGQVPNLRMDADAVNRASRDASLVLSLALPADVLIYLLLPLHHAAFGVTLGEAGLLLAANRLVRIAGYSWVARLYAWRGPRLACPCSQPSVRRWRRSATPCCPACGRCCSRACCEACASRR